MELLNRQQKRRVIADTLFLLGVFIFPWWFLISVLLVAFFYFSYFFEFVVFALLIDLLYGSRLSAPFGINVPLSLVALVIFIVLEVFKDYIILDSHK